MKNFLKTFFKKWKVFQFFLIKFFKKFNTWLFYIRLWSRSAHGPRSLHDPRLKIICRSVESDSESNSEVTQLRLQISKTFWKTFWNFGYFFKLISKSFWKKEFFVKKVQFPLVAHGGVSGGRQETYAQTARSVCQGKRRPEFATSI